MVKKDKTRDDKKACQTWTFQIRRRSYKRVPYEKRFFLTGASLSSYDGGTIL